MDYLISKKEINFLITRGKEKLQEKKLVLVLNEVGKTKKRDEKHANTDFFSKKEVKEFRRTLLKMKINFEIIVNEDDFIQKVVNQKITSRNSIVWNLSRQGGNGNKKSVVTSLADFYKIHYIGSSVEIMLLSRDKMKFEQLILNAGLNGINTYNKNLLAKYHGKKNFIKKYSSESASIGINKHTSVRISKNKLNNYLKESNNIAEEFVQGYEVEVPVFKYNENFRAAKPVGISINNHKYLANKFLTENISAAYKYEHYDFYHYIKFMRDIDARLTLANLIHQAVKIAELLDFSNYGRVDFRVDLDGNCYCFDTATTPYFIKHSSLFKTFDNMGFSQGDLIFCILGTDN